MSSSILDVAPVDRKAAGGPTAPGTAALGARLAATAAIDPGSIKDEDVAAWRTGSVSYHCTVFHFAVGHLVDRVQSDLSTSGLVKRGNVDA
ncbi:hypothetical protein L0U85_01590 [Glycomyces sp. L485]|uniref:hypothetical protein n=1 Tax=Glycomyces sp. L485 TaxID=2909235 RepID=UPI001F4A3220|nr:hypothetical protein [Glycomyces sp. L485]MCH7229560.1 hypothetical protein [Glycomyces sp. L485]